MRLPLLKPILYGTCVGMVLQIIPISRAHADNEISAEILVQGTTSWDGSEFSYPSGIPQLTIQKISVKPGGSPLTLSLHCHPIPIAAVVQSGGVKVVKQSGQSEHFGAGTGFIEVSGVWHRGVVTEDTELLVFYAGAVDVPLSVGQNAAAGSTPKCTP